MTTAADRNDLMPAQEKLEWVTPKISLMVAEDTEGKNPLQGIGNVPTHPAASDFCVDFFPNTCIGRGPS